MKQFVLFCFVVFWGYVSAQVPINIPYRTDSLQKKATVFSSMYATDSCYYILGVTVENGINVGFWSKFNLDGTCNFTKIIGDSNTPFLTWNGTFTYAKPLKVSQDGNFIFVGRHRYDRPFIAKITPSGDIIFSKEYKPQDTTHYYRFESIIEILSNSFYIIGTEYDKNLLQSNSAKLIYVNHQGDIMWLKTYNENNWNFSGLNLICNSNLFLLVSKSKSSADYPDYKQQTLLVKVDSSGNIITQYSTPSDRNIYAYELCSTKNGGTAITGLEYIKEGFSNYPYAYVGVIDSVLDHVTWDKNIRYMGQRVKIRKNGNLLTALNVELQLNGILQTASSLYEFDANNGDSIKQVFYKINEITGQHVYSNINDFEELPDSQIVVVGQIEDAYTLSPTAGYWGWLLRTDANGNAPGQVISLAPPQQADSFLSLHPNPAQTHITFSCTLPHAEIRIFDLAGRETALLPAGERTVWELAGQAAGMYFYSLMQDGRVVETGKFIIQQ